MNITLLKLCALLLFLFMGGRKATQANAAGVSIPQELGSYISMKDAETSGALTLSRCSVDGSNDGFAIGSTHNASTVTLALTNESAGDYVLGFRSGAKDLTATVSVEVSSGSYDVIQNYAIANTGSWTPTDVHYMVLDNLPAGNVTLKLTVTSTTKSYAGNYGYFNVVCKSDYDAIGSITLSKGVYTMARVEGAGNVGYVSNGATATYTAFNSTAGEATLNMGLLYCGDGTMDVTVTDCATGDVEITKNLTVTSDVCKGYDTPATFALGKISKGMKIIKFVFNTTSSYLCNYKNVGVSVVAPDIAYENVPVTATWAMGTATPSSVAVLTGDGKDVAFGVTNYSATSNFTVGKQSYNSITYTSYNPAVKQNNLSSDYYVEYRAKSLNGMTFTPSAFSLDAMRFGTNGGYVTMKYSVDGGTEITSSTINAINPNRNKDVDGLPTAPTSMSHSFSGVSVSKELVIRLYIYSLDNGRNVGFRDVTLAGTVTGTPDLAPEMTSIKVNDNTYVTALTFAQDASNETLYTATTEMSKTEALPSATNPVTVNVKNGTAAVSYDVKETSSIVTVKVTATDDETKCTTYVFTVNHKPDYTLTYYGLDNVALTTQTVEKDAAVSAFPYDYTTLVPSAGCAVRGWYYADGKKVTVADVITADVSIYAKETPLEVQDGSTKYVYNLGDAAWSQDEHENIALSNGSWHDTQHGWSFSNGTVTLKTGKEAYIILGQCLYSGSATYGATDQNGKVLVPEGTAFCGAKDGSKTGFYYKGTDNGTITIKLTGGYLHNVSIINTADAPIEKDAAGFFEVEAGNVGHFLSVLDIASSLATSEVQKLWLPNGTYDLGTACRTEIGTNVAIIGESREGVTIVNHPTVTGIQSTSVLRITGDNVYLQNLTLRSDVSYSGSAVNGVGVALEINGDKSICNNVDLQGNQDTYFSNGSETQRGYFKGGRIEGTVDYVCGGGNMWFEGTAFYNNGRSTADVVFAPSTSANTVYGYVASNCTFDGDVQTQKGKWNIARPWQGSPAVTLLNAKCVIEPSANGYTGMGSNLAIRFHEYNTVDADGTAITGHNLTACSPAAASDEVYMSSVGEYTYANVMESSDSWDPEAVIAQYSNDAVIGSTGFATVGYPYATVLPTGVTGYAVTSTTASTVTLTKVEAGTKIAANTGLIVSAAPAAYNFSVRPDGEEVVGNKLVANTETVKTATKQGEFYVLAVISDVDKTVGLKQIAEGGTLDKNKAYLPSDALVSVSPAKSLAFIKDGETPTMVEGVEDADAENVQKVIYNVAGQRLNADAKGFVIIGNRKYYRK